MPLLTAGPSRFLGGGAKWWQVPGATCVAAYQPKNAADLAASYVNLANPGTYNAAAGVAPTLAAGGWVFNGTQHLTNGLNLNGAQHSVIVRFSSVANTGYFFGSLTVGVMAYHVGPNGASGVEYRYTSGGAGTNVLPAMTAGVLALVPGSGGYRDGVLDLALGTVALTSSIAMYIAARNNAGAAQGPVNATIAAMAIYSDNPATVATNIAALTTRMQAL